VLTFRQFITEAARSNKPLKPGITIDAKDHPAYRNRTAKNVGLLSADDVDEAIKTHPESHAKQQQGNEPEQDSIIGARTNLKVRDSTKKKLGHSVLVASIHQKAEEKQRAANRKKGLAVKPTPGATSHERNTPVCTGGNVLGYRQAVTVDNAHFNVSQGAREKLAKTSAEGRKRDADAKAAGITLKRPSAKGSKTIMASIDGRYQRIKPEHQQFHGVELHMNPVKHHTFVDSDNNAVHSADRCVYANGRCFAQGKITYHSEESMPKKGGDAPTASKVLKSKDDLKSEEASETYTTKNDKGTTRPIPEHS